jgi:hypothetical protein
MPTKPDFTAVAKAIANPPPNWLPDYLEQFYGFICTEAISKEEREPFKQIIERMHYSMDHLIRWLPALAGVPGLGRWPELGRRRGDCHRVIDEAQGRTQPSTSSI